MSKSIRIRTKPGGEDTVLNVNLEQEFDFIEILSLKISQEEVYRRFCSDYGAVVGRVIANDGFGVPNAKVSIFIPLSDEDEEDEVISSIYPYKTVYDKNSDGVKYNLLPETQQFDCHTPVGTFPSKRKILDNDDVLEVYEKYYKYSTTTNNSGDYMLFGVPLGNQMIHVDLDLSDMGLLSQRPYDFIRQGHSKKSFDSPTKFSKSTNLDNLSQIVSQNMGVFVTPFWGDPENCQVGITRVDVDLNHRFEPCAIFMGSIFGDNEKNSLNKRCWPRKKLGELCDTVAAEGTIEMIRKDKDGQIEPFSPEGGRVIDEDGAWAYQIPMNLEYKVTDEEGNLIPSEDPTKGIPTRARVRFKIGMDQTGGEGRFRTRAKFLVPNNPLKGNTDYTFDETTPDTQFTDLEWNKLYTVRQFIPRYQRNCTGPNQGISRICANTRKFTGIKDVDDCGDHTPFPFNRLDSDFNPLYQFLAILMTIITTIVVLINFVLIPVINVIVSIIKLLVRAVNAIIGFLNATIVPIINGVIGTVTRVLRFLGLGGGNNSSKPIVLDLIKEPAYVPCITLKCDEQVYAPGCVKYRTPNCSPTSLDFPNGGWCEANKKETLNHWANDSDMNKHNFNSAVTACGVGLPPIPILPYGNAGYINCIQLVLAEALEVFEFDFYNDWINGSLYSFLLKYKKKKDGKSKFCEYDCVDTNTQGTTNFCKSSHIVDTCQGTSGLDAAQYIKSTSIKDSGLIKKVDNELFYAPENKNGNVILYATDITNLGAVLDYDFKGVPQIHPYLQPTTYNRPSLTSETTNNPNDTTEEAIDPLLFILSSAGISTCGVHCNNIRRICELGVDIPDESATIATIDASTIDDDLVGDYTRDVIAFLNDGKTTSTQTLGSMQTKFGNPEYNKFRDYQVGNMKLPKKNSYFFYFGIKPGATALDKANGRYFTTCETVKKNAFILGVNVLQNVTTINGTNGQIQITIDGGNSPYTYILTDSLGSSQTQTTNNVATFTNLAGGNYTIVVTDNLGLTASGSAFISEPVGITFSLNASDVSSFGLSDGSITVDSLAGGAGPYTATISPVAGATSPINIPIGTSGLFSNLPTGAYTVVVSDNGGISPSVSQTITVNQPAQLTLGITNNTNITCNGSSDGAFDITANGQSPLTIETFKFPLTGTYDDGTNVTPYTSAASLMTLVNANDGGLDLNSFFNNFTIQSGLDEALYVVRVTDGNGAKIINASAIEITNPPVINATASATKVLCNGGSTGTITVSANGGSGGFQYSIDGGTTYQVGNVFGGLSVGLYDIKVKDSAGCTFDIFNVDVDEPDLLVLTINSTTNVSAVGAIDGQINASATGGEGTKTFSINLNGTITTNTTGTFTGLAIGTYVVEVVDTNNCSKNTTVTIS